MSDGLIDKVKFTGSRTGSGAITAWVRIPPYRLPTDVKAVGDLIFLETRNALDDTIWEHAWYQIEAGGQLTIHAVVDTHQRSGEYNPATPPPPISFGGPVEVGAIANSVVIPAIGPDGRMLNGKAIRDSVIFPDIVTLQARNDLVDGEIFFTLSSLYTPSGGGASTGAGPGLLLQYSFGSAAAPDGATVFDLSSGAPGRLLKASIEVQAEFIRNQWSVYANSGGVSRIKSHVFARGAAGADAAWSGIKTQRGTDGAGAFTELLLVDNDRSGGVETPFLRQKSYGDANDVLEILKPFSMPAVATKTALLPGQIARATDDNRFYYRDANRGLAEILLSDGGPRASVANIADLRLLTPDGYMDGEIVVVGGAMFRGDGDAFAVIWSSGSSSADNGFDVFKPAAHADASPWVEAGRFLAIAPLSNNKFADGDTSPDVSIGYRFTVADNPAPITTFDGMRNGKRIVVYPNAQPQLFPHSSTFRMDGAVDFTLAPNDAPVFFEKENGVISMIGGGGRSSGQSFASIASVKALTASQVTAGDTIEVKGFSAAGDGGHNTFKVLSGNAAANGFSTTLDGVVFENTAGTLTFVQVDGLGRIGVRQVGAVGDNATDDQPEIAGAFGILPTTGLTPGGIIDFGRGHFKMDAGVQLPDYSTVRGVNMTTTRLNFSAAASGAAFSEVGNSFYNSYHNFTVEGPFAQAFNIDAASNGSIEKVEVICRPSGTTSTGIKIGLNSFLYGLKDIRVTNARDVAIEIADFTTSIDKQRVYAFGGQSDGHKTVGAVYGGESSSASDDVLGYAYRFGNVNCWMSQRSGAERSTKSAVRLEASDAIAALTGISQAKDIRNLRIANMFATDCGGGGAFPTFADIQALNSRQIRANFEECYDDYLAGEQVTINSATDIAADTITSTAHPFSDGDELYYRSNGGTIGGLVSGQYYFVVNSAANTFQLALTAGGAALTITAGTGAAHVFGSDRSVRADGALVDISWRGPTPPGGFSVLNGAMIHQYYVENGFHNFGVNQNHEHFRFGFGANYEAQFIADRSFQDLRADVYSSAQTWHGFFITGRRARGQFSKPLVANVSDAILTLDAKAHDGTDFRRAGQFQFGVGGAPSAGIVPGAFSVFLTDAAGALNNVFAIAPDKTVTIPGLVSLTGVLSAGGGFRMPTISTLTIASGKINAPTGGGKFLIDTESAAASDDLDGIVGGTVGDILVLQAANGTRTIVLKHSSAGATGAEKLWLNTGVDFSLDNTPDVAVLLRNADGWCSVSLMNNAA